MNDIVPDELEFNSLLQHDLLNKPNDLLTLEDPPEEERQSPSTDEIIIDETARSSTNLSENTPDQSISNPHEELLILNEPPEEEDENREKIDNGVSESEISEFVQNIIDPIVKEAIENQLEESNIDLSIEAGDKKSDKSLSDDGFEYVKQDDVNQSSGNQIDVEDDTFLSDELVIDNNNENNENEGRDESIALLVETQMEQEEQEPEQDSGKMAFDLEGIIEASNAGQAEESMIRVEERETYDPMESIEIVKQALEIDRETMEANSEDSVPVEMKSIETEKKQEIEHKTIESNLEDSEPIEPVSHLESREFGQKSDSDICRKCRGLFCWTDPILSAVVLITVMIVELGLMCDYSIITLFAYSGLMLLVSSFVYKIAVKFNLMKKHGENNCGISITGDDIQVCVDSALSWVEYLYNEFKSLTYVVSISKNLKAFIFFWMLTYIGQWFNLLSLIFIGTIILFSFPIIYIKNKETIDHVINKTNDQIKDSIAKLKSKSRQLIGRRAT